MYYKIKITETASNSLREDKHMFNRVTQSVKTLDDVRQFLSDRYGKIPNGRRKVYADDKEGNAVEVGMLHSFWNMDYSHNGEKWHQTDWICIMSVEETPVIL